MKNDRDERAEQSPSRKDAEVTTRTGDLGFTSLIGPDRIAKYDPRIIACGDLDEASSAIGIARAYFISSESSQSASITDALESSASVGTRFDLPAHLIEIQRDLYCVLAEIASPPAIARKLGRRIGQEEVSRLEELQAEALSRSPLPREFVLPGATIESGYLDLARTVVRRAERGVVRLQHDSLIESEAILRYLNRLSDLLFVWAREVESDRRLRARG